MRAPCCGHRALANCARCPQAPSRLVSRRTPEWDRLYAEGLFHPGYPRLRDVDPSFSAAEDLWNERVAKEWPNGTRTRLAARHARARALPPHVAQRLSPSSARGCAGCKPLPDGKKRCLPSLIIIGQFKCGTTALFDTLAQHPDLLLPHSKKEYEHKCPRQQPTCVIKEVNGAH